MSIRNTLTGKVARCAPYAMQLATFQGNSATGSATVAQQNPAIPRGIRVHAATAIATAMQQRAKSTATLAPFKTPESCAVASSITAHRQMKELIESAMRACDHFNDNEAAREQMRQDCLAVPVHQCADLLDHFSQTYPKGRRNDLQPPVLGIPAVPYQAHKKESSPCKK